MDGRPRNLWVSPSLTFAALAARPQLPISRLERSSNLFDTNRCVSFFSGRFPLGFPEAVRSPDYGPSPREGTTMPMPIRPVALLIGTPWPVPLGGDTAPSTSVNPPVDR